VGRCSLPLPPFPPYSSIPRPAARRRAPSPPALREHLPSPHTGHGDPRGHRLSGTGSKNPHEMNAALSVPQKCCMGSRAQLPTAFGDLDAGIVNEELNEIGHPASTPLRPAQPPRSIPEAGWQLKNSISLPGHVPWASRAGGAPRPAHVPSSRGFGKGRTVLESEDTHTSITANKLKANHLGPFSHGKSAL